jgi:hypothetical protein
VDEDNIFSLLNRWVVQPTFAEAPALVARDLAILRGTPRCRRLVATNGIPLGRRGWRTTIDTRPVDPGRSGNLTSAELYFLDEQGAEALGFAFAAGPLVLQRRGRTGWRAGSILSGHRDTRAGRSSVSRGRCARQGCLHAWFRPGRHRRHLENLQISSPAIPPFPSRTASTR